jgi:hypothetical protein
MAAAFGSERGRSSGGGDEADGNGGYVRVVLVVVYGRGLYIIEIESRVFCTLPPRYFFASQFRPSIQILLFGCATKQLQRLQALSHKYCSNSCKWLQQPAAAF